MRIKFKHEQVTQGLVFRKTYQKVTVLTDLSDTERFLVQKQGFQDHMVCESVPANARTDRDPAIYCYYVRDVMRGRYEYHAANVSEARAFEELALASLENFKAHLDDGEIEPEDRTIEL